MATQRLAIGILGLQYGQSDTVTVEEILAKTLGVLRVYVSGSTEMAYVEFDPSRTSAVEIASSMRSAGFEVEAPIPLG